MKDFSPAGRKIKMLSVEFIFGSSAAISIILSFLFYTIYKINCTEQFVVCALLFIAILITEMSSSIVYAFKKYNFPLPYKYEILMAYVCYIGIFFLSLIHPVVAFFSFVFLTAMIIAFAATDYYRLVLKVEHGLILTKTYDNIVPAQLRISNILADTWISSGSLEEIGTYLLRQAYHRNELHLYSDKDLCIELFKDYYRRTKLFNNSDTDKEINKILKKIKNIGV